MTLDSGRIRSMGEFESGVLKDSVEQKKGLKCMTNGSKVSKHVP